MDHEQSYVEAHKSSSRFHQSLKACSLPLSRSQSKVSSQALYCHHLSTWLNCLIGLSCGIVGFVMILPIMCTVCMSVPLSLVFPRSYRLALGQRPSLMYYSSYCCLMGLLATLEGPGLLCLPLCLLIAYCLLTDCLLIVVLLSPLVMDLIRMTHVLYQPSCGLSYK